MSEDSNYIEAMKIVVGQTKASIAVSAAPLALLLAQSRHILALEGVWYSLLMTSATVSLFVATVFSWLMAYYAEATLASETFQQDGKEPRKGQLYKKFIWELSNSTAYPYTEAHFIKVCRHFVWPTVYAIVTGYVSLFVLMLSFIWGSA